MIGRMESEWERYLKLVRLDKMDKGSVQYTETKRAFFGGISSLLVYMGSNKILGLDDTARTEVVQSISDECSYFWEKESL